MIGEELAKRRDRLQEAEQATKSEQEVNPEAGNQ